MDTRWKRSNSGSAEQLITFGVVLLTNPFIALALGAGAKSYFNEMVDGLFVFLS